MRLEESRALLWRHLATTRPEIMQDCENKLNASLPALNRHLEEYERSLLTPEDRVQFGVLSASILKFRAGVPEVLRLSRLGNKDAALDHQLIHIRPAVEKATEEIMTKHESNISRAKNANLQLTGALQVSRLRTAAALVVMLFCGVGITRFSQKVLTRRVGSVINEVSLSSARVASASQAVSQSSTELTRVATHQSASVTQIGSSIEVMERLVDDITRQSGRVEESLDLTLAGARQSHQALEDMRNSMSEIQDASRRVSSVIAVIEQIAFQTNLLALNAAVESARAGHAGMGFAVVAEEVRRLAGRSSQAAHDSTQLVRESIQSTTDGAKRLDEVAAKIDQMVQDSSRIRTVFAEVLHSVSEQRSQMSAATRAMAHIGTGTRQAMLASEQGLSATLALEEQSSRFDEISRKLRTLVSA